MTGLRQSQKAARRAVMLAAASRLFDAKGYARTTFREIAAAAHCGVMTVYKHFHSKEGIVVALLQPDLHRILITAQAVIERPPADVARAMVRLLSAYRELGGHNWARRELLRLTVFPTVGNGGLLTAFINEAEAATQRQIRSLLTKQRHARQLKSRLSLEDATAVIFALLNHHFGMFMTQRNLSFEQMFRMLARRVRLVFDNWRP
jgi:AcrR family transcriptional regulator